VGIERVSEGETTEEEAPYEERPIPPDRPGSEGHLSRSESRAAAREANDREPAADEEAHDTPTESVEGNPEQLKTSNLEGRRDYVVVDPADPSRTITDIDHIEDGTLWEEKSATSAVNIDKWVAKHIDKKFGSYLEARRNLTGYEEAPIGFKFTEPNADPEFVSAVEEAVGGLRKSHPDVKIRLEWS
jgi:hypothetical protein